MKSLLIFAASLTGLVTASAPAPVYAIGLAPSATRPAVTLALSLRQVYAGETATVRWRADTATWCRASGAWSGGRSIQGEEQVGPLFVPGRFQLECGNGAGSTVQTLGYSVAANRPTSGIGVFDIGCNFSHSLPDDPIVFPRQPGASHMHDFFGFTGTNAFSTSEDMRRTLAQHPDATTCTEGIRRDGAPPASNASAYWAPAMYVNGQKVDASHVHIYYRQELKQPVRAFAPAFRMLAGDAHATAEQAKAAGVIRWWCGGLTNPEVDRLPSDCPGRSGIHAEIRFPPCWDGRIDSPNHKDHLAYRRETGQCPDTHPFRLPRIVMHIDFDVRAKLNRDLRATDTITLASGGMWTMHADYLFAWDPFRLDLLVHACLNGRVNCKLIPPPPSAQIMDGPGASGGAGAAPIPSAPQPTQSAPGNAKKDELAPTLNIVDTSPESPRAGKPFSVSFVVAKGADRLEITRILCGASIERKLVPLKSRTIEGRVGTCVWALPDASGKTLVLAFGALFKGGYVHKTSQETIR